MSQSWWNEIKDWKRKCEFELNQKFSHRPMKKKKNQKQENFRRNQFFFNPFKFERYVSWSRSSKPKNQNKRLSWLKLRDLRLRLPTLETHLSISPSSSPQSNHPLSGFEAKTTCPTHILSDDLRWDWKATSSLLLSLLLSPSHLFTTTTTINMKMGVVEIRLVPLQLLLLVGYLSSLLVQTLDLSSLGPVTLERLRSACEDDRYLTCESLDWCFLKQLCLSSLKTDVLDHWNLMMIHLIYKHKTRSTSSSRSYDDQRMETF